MQGNSRGISTHHIETMVIMFRDTIDIIYTTKDGGIQMFGEAVLGRIVRGNEEVFGGPVSPLVTAKADSKRSCIT